LKTYIRIFFTLIFTLAFYATGFAFETYYYRDINRSKNSSSVVNVPFIAFNNKVNKGLQNGIYWVKIKNNHQNNIVEITSARISDVKAYINGKQINSIKGFFLPAFTVNARQTMYLKVLCEKEATIPIVIHPQNNILQTIQNNIFFYGLYYGFSLLMVILNIFYFFNFKEKTFLLYSFFLASVSLSLFYRDGLASLIFNTKWLQVNCEIIFHFLSAVFGCLFASEYLRLHIHYPRVKYYTISIICLMFVGYCVYLFANIFTGFIIAELCGITLLAIYFISSVPLFYKSAFYKFFTIAYFLFLILSIDFFILPLLGLPNQGITTFFIKIASVVEMLILSYAVAYRMRVLQKENTEIQQEIFKYFTQVETLEQELIKLKEGKKNSLTNASLSTREIEIFTLIASGISTKDMAINLHLSVNTVKYHIKNLYEKLEISTRQEAVVRASDMRVIN
jgi:DNA-binding CsgD family transcriptional regulator